MLQPIGYVGKFRSYSPGNYLFNSKSLDTRPVEAVFERRDWSPLQFIPAKQENCRVTKAEGAEKERILHYMRKISPETARSMTTGLSLPDRTLLFEGKIRRIMKNALLKNTDRSRDSKTHGIADRRCVGIPCIFINNTADYSAFQ